MITALEFLRAYRQDAGSIATDSVLGLLLADMEAGLENRPSGLEMNPSYLAPDLRLRPFRKVVVIDAGGTNLRSGLAVTDAAAACTLHDVRTSPMPGSGSRLGRSEFYDAIAAAVGPVADAAEAIGFCFSYSVAMTPEGDGILTDWAKEIDAPAVIGTRVGAGLLDALRRGGGRAHRITLLNDTVATLLGGSNNVPAGLYADAVGFVAGTGVNVCYAEPCANIRTLREPAPSGRMIVNTECGNFDKIPQGDFDRIVDARSQNPGKATAEKMAAGKYLSDILLLAWRRAADDGLFGESSVPDALSMRDLSAFVAHPDGGLTVPHAAFRTAADRAAAASIARALIDRAAKIGAIMTAAAILRTAAGRRDPRPVAVFAEGTTFRRLTGYREAFDYHLDSILTARGIAFRTVTGSDWNLTGAAAAAMQCEEKA